MTTAPLTGYYSTGYYNNSITPIPINASAHGIKIAKAKDNNKLYFYNGHDGTIIQQATTIYPHTLSGAAVPLIGADGSITGSLNSFTSSCYTSAIPSVALDYDKSSLAGKSFWKDGIPATGTWDDGIELGGVRQYVNGLLHTGIHENVYYNNGIVGSTFRASDGKAYKNGNLFSGTLPGGKELNPLNWLNLNTTIPAPLVTLTYTNGISAAPIDPPVLPIPTDSKTLVDATDLSPHRYTEGVLYISNTPFKGTLKLDSKGVIKTYNNSNAPRSFPVIPLTAINPRFSSALRNDFADVSFDRGYPITGYVNNLYYYKGMSTTNVELTSYSIYFNDGALANGVIGNKVYSFGTLVSE